MDIKEFINLVTNVGFPVVMCSYLLIKLGKQLQSLTSSINKLNNIISAKLGIVVVDTDSIGENDKVA